MQRPCQQCISSSLTSILLAISGLIYSISSGEGLPEDLARDAERLAGTTPGAVRSKLMIQKALSIYSPDQLFIYAWKGSGEEFDDGMVATLAGVQYVLEKLVGDDFEFISDSAEVVFSKVDAAGEGKIGKEQFKELLAELQGGDQQVVTAHDISEHTTKLSQTQQMFDTRSRRTLVSTIGPLGLDATVKSFLNNSKGKFSAKNWSMLYCGGSEAILSQLKDYKKDFGRQWHSFQCVVIPQFC